MNFVLVGNKCDLASSNDSIDDEDVPADIEELMNDYGVSFFKTSALSGKNVEELFEYIAEIIAANSWTPRDKLDIEEPNKWGSLGGCGERCSN